MYEGRETESMYIEKIMDEYGGYVYSFALSRLKNESDAADVYQNVFTRLFEKQYQKAKKAQPLLESKLKKRLAELSEVEKQNETNPDIPANVFARLLGEVFEKDEELYQTGYLLGRFIYLADACCDFKKDLKKGRYNPLVKFRKSDFSGMLARELFAVIDELSKREINAYRDIIDNVLYHGVWIKIRLETEK